MRTQPPPPPPAAQEQAPESGTQYFTDAHLAEAVSEALAGARVEIWAPDGAFVPVAIAPGTDGRSAVTVGDAHFTQPGPTDAASLLPAVSLALALPAGIRGLVRGIELPPPGQPGPVALSLARPDGGVDTSRLVPGASADGKTAYEVEAPQACFPLAAPTNRDIAPDFGLVAGTLAQTPAALRGALHELHLETGASPDDDAWAKKYNKPGFVAGGTAAQGRITMWQIKGALDPGTMVHELGHLVGEHYSSKGELYPDDWPAAIASDGQQVSDYGTVNPNEDFAESWRLYAAARAGHPEDEGDPDSLEAFAKRFPARARLIAAIMDGSLKPVKAIEPSCAAPQAPSSDAIKQST